MLRHLGRPKKWLHLRDVLNKRLSVAVAEVAVIRDLVKQIFSLAQSVVDSGKSEITSTKEKF